MTAVSHSKARAGLLTRLEQQPPPRPAVLRCAVQTDDPRRSELKRCCMYDVRRVLGISRGGDAALMAVAHLAGGDYDLGGADNVGETLALGAVRQLLAGCEVRAGTGECGNTTTISSSGGGSSNCILAAVRGCVAVVAVSQPFWLAAGACSLSPLSPSGAASLLCVWMYGTPVFFDAAHTRPQPIDCAVPVFFLTLNPCRMMRVCCRSWRLP